MPTAALATSTALVKRTADERKRRIARLIPDTRHFLFAGLGRPGAGTVATAEEGPVTWVRASRPWLRGGGGGAPIARTNRFDWRGDGGAMVIEGSGATARGVA
jgi:hypothetical protein